MTMTEMVMISIMELIETMMMRCIGGSGDGYDDGGDGGACGCDIGDIDDDRDDNAEEYTT